MAVERDTPVPAARAGGARSQNSVAASSAAGSRRWVRRRRAGAVAVMSAGVLGQVGLDGVGDVGGALLGLGGVAGGGGLAQGGEVVLEADVEVLVVGPDGALDLLPLGFDALVELLGRLGVSAGGQADLADGAADLPEPDRHLGGGRPLVLGSLRP